MTDRDIFGEIARLQRRGGFLALGKERRPSRCGTGGELSHPLIGGPWGCPIRG